MNSAAEQPVNEELKDRVATNLPIHLHHCREAFSQKVNTARNK